ncbi:MAG: DUF2279 domain-containing protein [Cyclobacteriaceae bacterium]
MKKPYLKKMTEEVNKRSHPSAVHHFLTILLLPISFLIGFNAQAQTDSTVVNRKRLNTILIASSVGYTAGLVTLNHVWYKDTERQSFRFFNDNAEWKQLDKAGHFISSFFVSDVSSRMLRSCDLRERKANVIGALSGFLLTLPIEILDGFSDGYGASIGDVVADAAGPAFFLGQQIAWGEIRVHPKFSFHRTAYAPLRPALLGDDLLSEIVKDYNGQTFWLSLDVDKFTPFPRWLNIALGYGGNEMVFARDSENLAMGYHPFRQYYLAIDLDLSGIKTRSKVIKTLLYVANIIRLPAPALEFSSKGSKFYPFYF